MESTETAENSSARSIRKLEGRDDSASNAHLYVFSNAKAGMQAVDKEHVNRVIYEMSKNSSYFKQAKLQDEKVDSKVAEMKAKLKALGHVRKAQLTRQADRLASELEAQRELDSVCFVVDMDMFYAAVEIRDRPELASKPVAVGGESMISTTNYHARQKGVRSAMPGFIGRKLCPDLVFVKPDFKKYTLVAEQIRDIFREYDPRMRSYSLDEALLNVTDFLMKSLGFDKPTTAPAAEGEEEPGATKASHSEEGRTAVPLTSRCVDSSPYFGASGREGCFRGSGPAREGTGRRRGSTGSGTTRLEEERDEEKVESEDDDVWAREEAGCDEERRRRKCPREERRARLFEAARALAKEIRGRIKKATQLTASVGIGPNFMLAKIASDWNKPDGQMCIEGSRAEVLRFLHDLPVRKVGGIGKVQEKCLREAMGVVTCGDLFRERAACLHVMTPHTSRWLIKVALGIASAEHDVATEQAQAAGAITRKQISKERTFGELSRPRELLSKCREICEFLAADMAANGLEAKSVGLKVKTTKFEVRTLDSTGQTYVSSADDLYAAASALLQREIRAAPGGRLRLRLMGVKAFGFRGQAGAPILPGQVTLDGFLVAPKTAMAEGEGLRAEGVENGDIEEEADHEKEVEQKGDGEQGRLKREGSGVPTALGTPVAFGHPMAPCPSQAAVPAQKQERLGSEPEEASWKGASNVATAAAATPNVTSVACPVCGEELGAASNAAVNRHLDACLGVCTSSSREVATFSRKRPKISAAGIERFFSS